MALYLGSKKVAGNTTSEPIANDIKNYNVTFDDTGVIEETSTVNDIMNNEIKTGNKVSVIFGGIKKVLSNILTSITNINSSLSTFNNNINDINTSLEARGTIINVSGTKAAVYGKNITLCSITLPDNAPYLLLATVNCSISGTSIINATINGYTTRTTMNSGGGCMVYSYTTSGGTFPLASYGYQNSTYNLIGRITAIRLQ